ncbi:hypothetical protein F4780DRAFT_347472 [Xylariomycetidae sp. FL0641]|nr:hypothetical protein F4780DRAFT_347472 [Xylariomycetidae sp. FL0641]
MRSLAVALCVVLQLVSAHFAIEYPVWRADTLENDSYSQWEYPCGGVPYGVGNRTDWPTSGGSVSLDLHHPWTYLYINLGLGDNVTNFNLSLTPSLMNVTGSGNFCIPSLPLPMEVSDGQNATIQVVTNGESGSALYNCADITFRSAAQALPGDDCQNSTGVTAAVIDQSTNTTTAPAETTTPSLAVRGAWASASWGLFASIVIMFAVSL